jgi:transketolase
MNALEKRVIDISYQQGLSHIGSNLTAVNIIDDIYGDIYPAGSTDDREESKFVLSSGHAHLAHLVVREKYYGEKVGKIHNIHCNNKDGCDVSTGSLGLGLPIAVGMALADINKSVYCLVSDGELAEGSCWEALRIADELELDNLKIYVNANSYGAYKKIDLDLLEARVNLFNPRVKFIRTHLPKVDFVIDPQEWHYKVLNKVEYEELTK